MTTTWVPPISTEASALRQTLRTCQDVLGGASISVLLLHDGVLRFVTTPVELDDGSWQRIAHAITASEAGSPAFPDHAPAPDEVAIQLTVSSRPAGVLLARRPGDPFTGTELALLRVITQRVAAAAENGRLHANLTELLADYMSGDVATALLHDPTGTRLGGETRDVTVLFADLSGFTRFSERTDPAAVVALLNRLFAAAVPAIVEHGGTVSAFIGDAIMGLFGAPRAQPEHPLLAARAALAMQEATGEVVAGRPDLPRFRVGVNTGPATVGNLGSPRRRVYTAIGDTVNLASRLESAASPGGVVIGAETYAIIRSLVEVRTMPPLSLKGKSDPVQAYELLGLRADGDLRMDGRTVTIRLEPTRRESQAP